MRSAQLTALASCLLLSCASKQATPPPPPEAEKTPPPAPVASTAGERDAGSAPAAPEVQPLPEQEGAIAEGQLCESCHSAELIRTTRIGLAGWMAEMTKMRNWGALVDDQMAAPFAAWFARHYPSAEPAPAPAVISPSEAIAVVAPQREKRKTPGNRRAGATLYTTACAACHGPNAEGLGGGPVLIETPILYQRDRFTAIVRNGKGRMPASQGIGSAEINNLLAYLRQLH